MKKKPFVVKRIGSRPRTGIKGNLLKKRIAAGFEGKMYFETSRIGERVMVIPLSAIYRITSDVVVFKQPKV